jgi:flagellar M-ring protein FliF
MEYFRQVFKRISAIVARMTVSQVVMLMAITVGFVFGTIAVVGWLSSATYVPLYSNLEPAEAGDITQYLTEQGISYEISAGGTTIEVPESDLSRARLGLAAQGMPNSGTVGYSIFDESNLGMTDFLQKLNFRRALEGELARTISGLNEVQACRVHIVIPEDRLFADQQKEATASIVLKLNRSRSLSKTQIAGIANLVASSVEGLTADNITIIDYDGNLLSSHNGGDALTALTGNQIEMTRNVEQQLEHKAQSMLDGVLGPGKAIVRVAAELDFQQVSRTSENYDPNTVAVRSEQRTENTEKAQNKDGEEAENAQDNRAEVVVTNYEVSKTTEVVNNAVGDISRLSVAVLLDGTYHAVENENGVKETVYEPRTQEEIDRLSAIVKNAVGFSTDRNDQIEVVNIAFDNSYLEEQQKMLDQQYTREFYYDIAKRVIIVLIVLAALFYLRKKIKKLFAAIGKILPPYPPQQRVRHVVMSKQQSGDQQEELVPEINVEERAPKLVDQMQKVAKDEPQEIAKVIKTMMVD